MKHRLTVLTAALALGGVAWVQTSTQPAQADFPIPAPAAAIAGQVLVDGSGQPVVGETVSLLRNGKRKLTTKTDRDGQFIFDDLFPGSFVIEVAGAPATDVNIGSFALFITIEVDGE